VIFDTGEVKVAKKINIIPGLQLVLNEGHLEEEEEEREEEEVENIDTEIEQENTITPEDGDGK